MEEKKTLKEWIDEKTDFAKWKFHEAKEWCKQNKGVIVLIAPPIIGGFIEIIKISTKNHVVNEEKSLKERYIYDHSAGHYYELKRKPKNSEYLQIDQRKQNGETLGEILSDMRLLK